MCPANGRVLIAEDDESLASMLAETFTRHDLETRVALTGASALREVVEFGPGLLVLDLGLPDGDGFQVVAWLRTNVSKDAMAVLVYTARDLTEADQADLRNRLINRFLS